MLEIQRKTEIKYTRGYIYQSSRKERQFQSKTKRIQLF